MFSSPAIRPFAHQENTNILMAKKLGSSSVTRKPFADRSVNSKGPNDFNKPLKPRLKLCSDSDLLPLQKATPIAEKTAAASNKTKPDLSFYDDYCSYKEPEDLYEDILQQSDLLSIETIDKHIKAYYGIGPCDTPPPVDLDVDNDVDSMFCELPKSHFEFEFTRPMEKVAFMDDSYEVPLPEIDFDDY